MAIPALVFPAANARAETWIATITPKSVRLWCQDNSLNHVVLSREDLLQILAVLNGAARLTDSEKDKRA